MDKQIEEYYQLKEKYERNIDKQKRKIVKNDSYTLEQKRQRLPMLIFNCVRCGKEGGTIFSNKGRVLRVVCGNKSAPCGLNITINRKDRHFVNLEKEMGEILTNIVELKNEVIKIKLELLFEYIDEDMMLKRFTKIKANLTKNIKLYDGLSGSKIALSADGELVRHLEKEVSMIINEMKSLGENLKEEPERERTIKDMIELYIDKLEPKLNEISSHKYLDNFVRFNENENEYILIQNKENLKSLEVNLLEVK